LLEVGFSRVDAVRLANHEYFHHKRKTKEELKILLRNIAQEYQCTVAKVKEIILKFPPFTGYNHSRVVRKANQEYNDDARVKEAILKYPAFAGLDHSRVVREASLIYGNEARVIEAILKYPRFAGYDHTRAVREANKVYDDEARVKEAILRFPQFVGLDHSRVVREASLVYGAEPRVKEAILKQPSFAGLDHSRVVRQKSKLGRIVGLDRQDVIDKILDSPFLAGCSVKRYIATLDIGQRLAQEGFAPDKILDTFFRYSFKSPYVPGTKRQRISKAQPCQEPQLLIKMRKSLIHQSKKIA